MPLVGFVPFQFEFTGIEVARHVVEFVDFQVSAADAPYAIDVGLAYIATVG